MVSKMLKDFKLNYTQLFITAWLLIGTSLSLAGPGLDGTLYATIVLSGFGASLVLQPLLNDMVALVKEMLNRAIDETSSRKL